MNNGKTVEKPDDFGMKLVRSKKSYNIHESLGRNNQAFFNKQKLDDTRQLAQNIAMKKKELEAIIEAEEDAFGNEP